MTGFYTEDWNMGARPGPNQPPARVACDRHRLLAGYQPDPRPFPFIEQAKQHSPEPGTIPRGAGLKPMITPLTRPPQRTPPANALQTPTQLDHPSNLEKAYPMCLSLQLNTGQIRRLCPFPPHRFHVLFNSLFKVLCNFPSRYLFAIGLVVIFSLR